MASSILASLLEYGPELLPWWWRNLSWTSAFVDEINMADSNLTGTLSTPDDSIWGYQPTILDAGGSRHRGRSLSHGDNVCLQQRRKPIYSWMYLVWTSGLFGGRILLHGGMQYNERLRRRAAAYAHLMGREVFNLGAARAGGRGSPASPLCSGTVAERRGSPTMRPGPPRLSNGARDRARVMIDGLDLEQRDSNMTGSIIGRVGNYPRDGRVRHQAFSMQNVVMTDRRFMELRIATVIGMNFWVLSLNADFGINCHNNSSPLLNLTIFQFANQRTCGALDRQRGAKGCSNWGKCDHNHMISRLECTRQDQHNSLTNHVCDHTYQDLITLIAKDTGQVRDVGDPPQLLRPPLATRTTSTDRVPSIRARIRTCNDGFGNCDIQTNTGEHVEPLLDWSRHQPRQPTHERPDQHDSHEGHQPRRHPNGTRCRLWGKPLATADCHVDEFPPDVAPAIPGRLRDVRDNPSGSLRASGRASICCGLTPQVGLGFHFLVLDIKGLSSEPTVAPNILIIDKSMALSLIHI